MRRFSALVLLAALSACGEDFSQGQGEEDPKYAGLDQQIRAWRAEILKADDTCQGEAKAEKCVEFEVTCKVNQPLTPAEEEAGLVSRVVVAMRWQGWNDAHSEHRAVLKGAEFVKSGKSWTRKDVRGVNPDTCAVF